MSVEALLHNLVGLPRQTSEFHRDALPKNSAAANLR
jgi:hypothetical protein